MKVPRWLAEGLFYGLLIVTCQVLLYCVIEAMCDLSDRYRKEDEARGEARGFIKGRAKEIICFAKKINYTYEEIKARLKQRLNINDDEAENYMKLYWNEK